MPSPYERHLIVTYLANAARGSIIGIARLRLWRSG